MNSLRSTAIFKILEETLEESNQRKQEQQMESNKMNDEIKLSDEVHNYAVKDDKTLTSDYYKLLDLQKTIDVLINCHFNEIKERSVEGPVNGYRVTETFSRNMFSQELAQEWLNKNFLTARFSVTKPAYEVPEETSVDFKALQKDLKNRYKDDYTTRFCTSKVSGEKLELVDLK